MCYGAVQWRYSAYTFIAVVNGAAFAADDFMLGWLYGCRCPVHVPSGCRSRTKPDSMPCQRIIHSACAFLMPLAALCFVNGCQALVNRPLWLGLQQVPPAVPVALCSANTVPAYEAPGRSNKIAWGACTQACCSSVCGWCMLVECQLGPLRMERVAAVQL